MSDYTANLEKLKTDVQSWISAGNFMVSGYPSHDHVWTEDRGVVMTNPPIYHRTCNGCGLRQERLGDSAAWTSDEFENIARLVVRLKALQKIQP